MKIVIVGGTGQVGTVLARAFYDTGDEVVVVSRKPQDAPWRMAGWDGRNVGIWAAELEEADALINLAGRSVNCRYGEKHRREIMDSRVFSVRTLARAIAQCSRPPRVWLQASTATIYAHRYDAANTESTGIIGGQEPNAPDTWRFSIDVATSWEKVFHEAAATPQTRKVLLRSAIMMSPDHGGAFDIMLRLVRFGLGGAMGDGRQFVSWIHDEDFVRAVRWLIEHEEMEGFVNMAAPNPLSNRDFLRELREAWGIGLGLPAFAWMLEIGAVFLRTETELILKSRRVTPERLLEAGFTFRYSTWPEAARELCERWRSRR